MRLKFGLLATVIALLVSCAEPEPPPPAEQRFIDNVTTALGGDAAIEATQTLTITGSGRMLNVGQDLTPDATTMVFDLSDYRRSLDFANQSIRTGLTRTPLFDYFRGRDPARLVWGLDGDVAYDVAADGTARRAHENVAAERRSAFYHHPLALIRAVLLDRATLSNVRDEVGLTLADITVKSGKVFTLAIDASTHLPTHIRSTDHHFYLRDVVCETSIADYAPAGDLRLPTVISLSLDEFHVSRI